MKRALPHTGITPQAKLANHVTTEIWVGFTEGHQGFTYHVNNPETKRKKDMTSLTSHMVTGTRLKNLC